MEGGGGSGNKTTGGLAGFFGAAGAGYSDADLAGVPLTGMNPLSPYLNVDPRYLVQVRTLLVWSSALPFKKITAGAYVDLTCDMCF